MTHKILMLNDGRAWQNWGLQATSEALLQLISSTGQSIEFRHLDHSYMHRRYLRDPKRYGGKKIWAGEGKIRSALFPPFHLLPGTADEFHHVATQWLAGKGGRGADEFMAQATNADAVIFNAEGSVYRDTNIGAIKGLFMLWFAKQHLGIPAFFVNGSVTLTQVDAVLPGMVRKVFTAIDFISLREPASYANVTDYYPELAEKLTLIPDAVFALTLNSPPSPNTPVSAPHYCALSLSMLPSDFRKSREKSALVYLLSELKKAVPHIVLLGKDREDQILAEIASITNSDFIGASHDYRTVLSVLEQAKFFVSGRYHNAIFSTLVGCPVIPLHTTSQKIIGLSELFHGLMPRPVDPTDLWLTHKSVLKSARNILAQGEPLRQRYKARAAELHRDTANLTAAIWGVLGISSE